MEPLILLLMVAAGAIMALLFLVAAAVIRHESRTQPAAASGRGAADRDHVIASILFEISRDAGFDERGAIELVRRLRGPLATWTRGVDIPSWASVFAANSNLTERENLLDLAVQCVVADGHWPSPPNDSALLNLAFALGFHSDALVHLQAKYGFDDRAARTGSGPVRKGESRPEARRRHLTILGLEEGASQREVASSYRTLAARHHPDRFHEATAEERRAAENRFIEIRKAYEELLRSEQRR